MEYLIDFTSLPKSGYLYGGNAGLKRGVTWNGEKWIIKFPQETSTFENVDISFTTSPLSEYVGSHIYEILGYNVHQTVLGTFLNEKNGLMQLVVACRDFTENGKLKLIDYEAIKNDYSDELQIKLSQLRARLPVYKSKGLSSHTIPIEEIILQFKENYIFSDSKDVQNLFWEMLIIDCLVNNNDRNKNNWGFLYDAQTDRFTPAPIYDNGASFVSKHSDAKLQKLLLNKSALENSALNGMCYYTINNEWLNFRNFFKKLKENGLDAELNKASLKVLAIIEDRWKMIASFIEKIPNNDDGIKIMSDVQKEFFTKTMEIRFHKLLKPLR